MRLIDDTSRHNKGTNTIQTSGDLSAADITGDAVFGEDYIYHSYQIVPLDSTTAEFNVQGSNDNENWTNITGYSLASDTTGALIHGEWYSAYSRAVLTGTAGNCLINEIHKA